MTSVEKDLYTNLIANKLKMIRNDYCQLVARINCLMSLKNPNLKKKVINSVKFQFSVQHQ